MYCSIYCTACKTMMTTVLLDVNCNVLNVYCHCLLQKLEDIQEFLGLPLMLLTSRQVKIHKGPLSDHIKNWEDVNKTLTGTAYESFLQADY